MQLLFAKRKRGRVLLRIRALVRNNRFVKILPTASASPAPSSSLRPEKLKGNSRFHARINRSTVQLRPYERPNTLVISGFEVLYLSNELNVERKLLNRESKLELKLSLNISL